MASPIPTLRRSRSFEEVYREGRRYHTDLFVCIVHDQCLEKERAPERKLRVGYSIQAKIGNAVERNRARRRLREALRSLPFADGVSASIVIVAKAGLPGRPYEQVRAELKRVLGCAGLLVA